ncbi:hypothetical protein N3K66_005905 [Trichothecium roseum]|uniref:Uncharacterized protein n=1 Tax=Trichothecium roseum TaxID=47278 RepID=A0ACC0UZ75_9HYPO|nr:hypothetical protein N3K66_005905 [Trichothecium roseum]
MESTPANTIKNHRSFAVIFVLGPPGAGKGTLSAHLSRAHNLMHQSVGDDLRAWMRANPSAPLASQIRSKLVNQGFLDPEMLYPFIYAAIFDAQRRRRDDGADGAGGQFDGIIVDGFPRCVQQLESSCAWPYQGEAPLAIQSPASDDESSFGLRPDVVLSLNVKKHVAEARYLGRARDANDSEEKVERRFAEQVRKTVPAERD